MAKPFWKAGVCNCHRAWKTVVEADQVIHQLETGELVVGRQRRGGGFRGALDLLHLDSRVRSSSAPASRRINRLAFAVQFDGKHKAIGQVGIVRYRQQLGTLLALLVHPAPQVFGMIQVLN